MLTQNAELHLWQHRSDRVASVRFYNPNLFIGSINVILPVTILYFPVTMHGLVLVLAHLTTNDFSQVII